MSYFEFPHTRTYEGDLGYIIGKLIELTNSYNEFFALNKIKFADPIAWDITTQYAPYTIVSDVNTNMAYISKQPVPAGVDISNTDYWEPISSLIVDAQARSDLQDILRMFTNSYETGPLSTSTYAVGDYVTVETTLLKVTAAINIGDPFTAGVNVTPTTVEDMISNSIDLSFSNSSNKAIANSTVTNRFAQVQSDVAAVNADVQNAIADLNALDNQVSGIVSQVNTNTADIVQEANTRESEDNLLSSRIDAIASLPAGSTAADAEIIDARISESDNKYGSLGASIRANEKIGQDKDSFTTYTRSVLVNSGYITNNGNISAGAGWGYSNPINISGWFKSQLYIYLIALGFNNNGTIVNNISFYDKDDTYISGIYYTSSSSGTLYTQFAELPKHAHYMRLCSKTDNTNGFLCSIFKRSSFVVADPAEVYYNYIHKDVLRSSQVSRGYLDTDGAFVSAPSSSWFASDFIATGSFNKAFYRLNAQSGVSCIALYREDQTCMRTVNPTNASYAEQSGEIDISEATYIRYCYSCRADSAFTQNHCILFNAPEYNQYSSANAHLVNKPLSFNGKTAVFFGDSITQGYNGPGTITPNGYPKQFSDMVGMSYVNKGVGGATVYRVSGYPCIYDTVNATDLTGVDYIFLMGGVNDWQLGVTPAEFKSGLNDILGLLSGFTGEIILIAPLDTAGRKPIVTPASDLETFRQIVKEVACTEALSFVNGKLFDMPTAKSSQAFIEEMFGDTIHPSEAGYRLIARGLRNALL